MPRSLILEPTRELAMQVAKAAMGEAAESTQAALSAKDAQEFLKLQTGFVQPLAEKSAAYSRHLYDIASGVGAELSQAAEVQAASAQKQFATAVEAAVKNVPQGGEAAVAAARAADQELRRAREQRRAQARLGGGRIHHAMRTVGMLNKALDMMCERALSRTTRGKSLADRETVQTYIAESSAQLTQFSLFVLQTAFMVSIFGAIPFTSVSARL